MRVIERWPDPCRVDFVVLDPNLLDFIRESGNIVPNFHWLTNEVQKHLGMPCELRLVRWPTGQLESMEGRILGKEPEKEAMEQLQAKASRCRSEPERRFFWAAVKAHLVLEPAFVVKPYELDFAHPQLQIGVEIDGYQYHSEYDQRQKDYVRERNLLSQGWKIVRYTAREVLNDPDVCVRYLKKNMYLSAWHFRQQLGI
jgi:very-short-patch-repair endonuclease